MEKWQISESFVQLISPPGPCWAVPPVVSNFSATSFPNSPWAALAWEVQRREGGGGEGDSVSGRRALVRLVLRLLLFMCSVECG